VTTESGETAASGHVVCHSIMQFVERGVAACSIFQRAVFVMQTLQQLESPHSMLNQSRY